MSVKQAKKNDIILYSVSKHLFSSTALKKKNIFHALRGAWWSTWYNA